MRQFKHVSLEDIEHLLRDMRSNRNKEQWISSIVLEPEEHNKCMYIIICIETPG